MKIEISEDEREQLMLALLIVAISDEKIQINWQVMDGFVRKLER